MTWLLILRRIWPYIAGVLLGMAAFVWIDHRGYQRGFHARDAEVAALNTTIANVRTATAQARADDQAHAREVETKQQEITANVSTDYQQQLASLRARYDSLRASPAAHLGRGGTAGVPEVPDAAGRSDGAAAQDGLPAPDALIASEQALQLQALQGWVAGQGKVER